MALARPFHLCCGMLIRIGLMSVFVFSFTCLGLQAKPSLPFKADDGTVDGRATVQVLELFARKAFELRPITPGFESTDIFDLDARLQMFMVLKNSTMELPHDQIISLDDRYLLGIADEQIKTTADLIQHYDLMTKKLRRTLTDEEKRVAKNIAYQILRSGSSDLAPSLDSKDAIEIRLAGKLALENLKKDLVIEIYQTPLTEDLRAKFKDPKSPETSLESYPESFQDLDLAEINPKVEWDEVPQEDPALPALPVNFTKLRLEAPSAGWPKESVLVVFVRDSMKYRLPIQTFFKTYHVGKN